MEYFIFSIFLSESHQEKDWKQNIESAYVREEK